MGPRLRFNRMLFGLLACGGLVLPFSPACEITASSLGGDQGGGAVGSATGSGGSVPYEHCPAESALDSVAGKACNRPHQLVCVYQFTDGWEAAVCDCDERGKWSVFDGRAHSSLVKCPLNSPEQHSACTAAGQSCQYLDDSLLCTCNSARWECVPAIEPAEVEKCRSRVDPPLTDETTPIDQLSDFERTKWCNWFAEVFPGLGGDLPPDAPVHADGTVSSYTTAACGALCSERLSLNHCQDNLKLHDCKAPVKDLDDCAIAFHDSCLPANACDALHAQPGCEQTIFTEGETGMCKIPVQ
jgi:hypothetical protein